MKYCSRQNGFVTLMVAVMLMLIGSFVFFESADASIYLTKRFQNSLIAKKLHWAAQGGLECAFVVNKQNMGSIPTELDYVSCETSVLPSNTAEKLNLQVMANVVTGSLYSLESKASENQARGERIVAKNIEVTANSVMPGIFKTSSRLYLTGDFALLPNKNKQASGENECITMVVTDRNNFVHRDSTNGSKLVIRDKDGYNATQVPADVNLATLNESAKLGNFSCKDGYQSFNQIGTEDGRYLAKDIVEDPNMDMFKDLFGVSRDKWKTVRDSQFTGGGTAVINKDNTGEMVENCADKINKAYVNGAKRIWIDGSCYLGSSNVAKTDGMPIDLNTPADNPTNMEVMIVVRDGVIYSAGQVGISGLVYQFKSGERADSDISADMTKSCYLGKQCADSSHAEAYKNKAFYTHGSLYAFGGLAVDMENLDFDVFGSLWGEYDNSKWQTIVPSGGTNNVRWKEGTWRDYQ